MMNIEQDVEEGNKYSCTELWYLAEKGHILSTSVFEDQEGNQIVFTGVSFQLYYSDTDKNRKYIGMCVGDQWEYIGLDGE